MNTNLQSYIDQSRKAGMTDEQIRQGLLQSGWSMNDVNEGMMGAPQVSAGGSKFRMAMPSKTLIIALVVLVVAVGGYFAGAYYMANYQDFSLWPFEADTPIPTFTPRPSTTPSATPSVSPTPTPDGVVDCGETSSSSNDCFNSKFTKCEPAKVVSSVGSASTYYEVTRPNGDYCFVEYKILKSTNPDWLNKEMFCSLDPKKDFSVAIKDTSHCSGELYDLMTTK